MTTNQRPIHIAYCSVDNCGVSTRDGLPFFRCPKDPIRCQQWKYNLGFVGEHKYAKLTPKETYSRVRVCSNHFGDHCFTLSGKRLLITAVPMEIERRINYPIGQGQEELGSSSVKIESDASTCVRDISTQTSILPWPTTSTESLAFSIKSETSTQNLTHLDIFEDFKTNQPLSSDTSNKEGLKKRIKDASESSNKNYGVTEVLTFLRKNYPNESTLLIRNQLLLLHKSTKSEFEHFALTLNLMAPKSYQKLSKIIGLPSEAALGRIIQKWKISPGFVEFIFKAIELKVSLMPEISKDCILCFAEMPIKSNLFYNISRDEIIGFEDVYVKRSTDIATSALVVMARGISHNWTQPVAYFLKTNSTTIGNFKYIIFESIRKVKSVGLNVLAITSDLESNFYKMVKHTLKLTVESPYFYINDVPIFYLFNVPSLLKLTRNNFFSYSFSLGEGSTNKCFLQAMYDLDKVRQYRLAPELTDEHISPNGLRKKEIKLAAQVFSHSVAVAMQTYMDFGKIPKEAKATANFIEDMNKLFDLLNLSNQESGQTFMGTIEQIEFLNKMTRLFSNLNVRNENGKNVSNTLKFLYGWRLTISSVLGLWETLQKKNYKFLLTRNLNQDCMENYFRQIRNACDNAKNPTAIQFYKAFKKLFRINCFESTQDDCTLEDATGILLVITPDFLRKKEIYLKAAKATPILRIQSTDYKNLTTQDSNALVYFGGYFLTKCLLKHSCDICLDYCEFYDSNSSTLFGKKKTYEGMQNLFGSSSMPPTVFLEYLKCLEETFVSCFNKYCIQNNVGYQLKGEFSKTIFSHPCPSFPYNYFLSLYTRVRIYYTLKFANKEIKCQSGNKKEQTP